MAWYVDQDLAVIEVDLVETVKYKYFKDKEYVYAFHVNPNHVVFIRPEEKKWCIFDSVDDIDLDEVAKHYFYLKEDIVIDSQLQLYPDVRLSFRENTTVFYLNSVELEINGTELKGSEYIEQIPRLAE